MEKNIIDLLYKYDCVIVPGFGGFIAQNKSAVFHPMDYTFDPPRKIIGFNSDLVHSDGLLAHEIAKNSSISYDEAVQAIADKVAIWSQHLEAGKTLDLDGLGSFRLNQQHIEFEPYQALNFSYQSFGMQPVKGQYILRDKKEIVAAESNTMNSWLSYAAALGFAVMVGASAFFANDGIIQPQLSSVLPLLNNTSSNQPYIASESKPVAPIISLDTASDTALDKVTTKANMIESSEMETSVNKKNDAHVVENNDLAEEIDLSIKHYQVIGGSFKIYSKAMAHQAFLKQKGYDRAVIVGKVGNFYMVAFDTFDEEEQARLYKKELEKKGFDVFMRP